MHPLPRDIGQLSRETTRPRPARFSQAAELAQAEAWKRDRKIRGPPRQRKMFSTVVEEKFSQLRPEAEEKFSQVPPGEDVDL